MSSVERIPMDTKTINQIKHEASQLLVLKQISKATSTNKPIRVFLPDSSSLAIDLYKDSDNACYRAVLEALSTYEKELTKKFSCLEPVLDEGKSNG